LARDGFSLINPVLSEKNIVLPEENEYSKRKCEIKFVDQNEFLYILFTNYSYKEMNAGKESRQIARLKDVLRYVAKNYQEPIALKEAADIASLNQDYFCRMFKKCMGVTFLEYVNQIRINHIHEELLATEDSITDILEHNGFTNYKVFSRMFKAQFGMTPRKLRKLQEN
jgi:AraC-like DNA-binding protein